MTPRISRRDFLKLGGLLPLGIGARPLLKGLSEEGAPGQRANVLIVIFDALSALNLSMHGYGRDTMPNLERLAGRAVVYHNHYAASNFTSSGTASILTGTLPWTHRALEAYARVADNLSGRNIFSVFADHFSLAYTHNSWAMNLLLQFSQSIDDLIPLERLYLRNFDTPIKQLFYSDPDVSEVAWARAMKPAEGYSYSLYLSHFFEQLYSKSISDLVDRFPRGVPMDSAQDPFVLEHATSWLSGRLTTAPRPFLGYFHFLPPHAPYRASIESYNRFAGDGLVLPVKPVAEFPSTDANGPEFQERTAYDEYILYADQALAALYESLERTGVLDDTWLVVTSDHGEIFERGIIGHGNPTLFEPLLRVPLVIFEPGRRERLDVHAPTSAVDVLATLAHVAGYEVPEWCEGEILPPYSATASQERPLFAVQARGSRKYEPLTRATIAMRKGAHKVIDYRGYAEFGDAGLVRLYDLEADPEELDDLAAVRPELKSELLAELRLHLERADAPFRP